VFAETGIREEPRHKKSCEIYAAAFFAPSRAENFTVQTCRENVMEKKQ
jgi:hypothetical protein